MDVQTLSPDAVKTFEIDIDGKLVKVRTGRMAKQASGSVEIYCDDVMLLVTATESKNVREGIMITSRFWSTTKKSSTQSDVYRAVSADVKEKHRTRQS